MNSLATAARKKMIFSLEEKKYVLPAAFARAHARVMLTRAFARARTRGAGSAGSADTCFKVGLGYTKRRMDGPEWTRVSELAACRL